MRWQDVRPQSRPGVNPGRAITIIVIGAVGLLVLALAITVAGLVGGGNLLFSAGAGCQGLGGGAASAAPPTRARRRNGSPVNGSR